jgi:hypothetical protein
MDNKLLNTLIVAEGVTFRWKKKTLDFKLSPCCVCCVLSFGWYPDVWILCRCYGTLCLFHLHSSFKLVLKMKVFRNVGTENSDTGESTTGKNAITNMQLIQQQQTERRAPPARPVCLAHNAVPTSRVHAQISKLDINLRHHRNAAVSTELLGSVLRTPYGFHTPQHTLTISDMKQDTVY